MFRFSPRLLFSIVFFFAFFPALNAQKPQFVYKPHSNAGVANNLPAGQSELADFNADGFDDIIISAAGEFRLFLNQSSGLRDVPRHFRHEDTLPHNSGIACF